MRGMEREKWRGTEGERRGEMGRNLNFTHLYQFVIYPTCVPVHVPV